MDQVIEEIYNTTIDMSKAMTEEKYDDFDLLLNHRNALMLKVEELKTANKGKPYSQHAKQLLEQTFVLDQELTTQLKEYITKTKTSFDQLKLKKQMSKKYAPYLQQTDGIFIDSKK